MAKVASGSQSGLAKVNGIQVRVVQGFHELLRGFKALARRMEPSLSKQTRRTGKLPTKQNTLLPASPEDPGRRHGALSHPP